MIYEQFCITRLCSSDSLTEMFFSHHFGIVFVSCCFVLFSVHFDVSKLAPSWLQVGPKLAPSWLKLRPSWLQVGLSWPKLALGGPSGPNFGLKLAQVGLKMAHAGLQRPPKSLKLAPNIMEIRATGGESIDR